MAIKTANDTLMLSGMRLDEKLLASANAMPAKVIRLPEGCLGTADYGFAMNALVEADLTAKSVTTIGAFTFTQCMRLERVRVGGNIDHIGKAAFSNCSSLRSVDIEYGVEALPVQLFAGDTSLRQITLPASVRSMGEGIFEGCTSLEKIVLNGCVPELETGTFSGCTGLKELYLGDGLKKICRKAFGKCGALEKLSMFYCMEEFHPMAFVECDRLTTLELRKSEMKELPPRPITPDGGLNINRRASYCEQGIFTAIKTLTRVVLDTEIKELDEGVFSGCVLLKDINIGHIRKIGPKAFHSTGLKSVVINTDSINIGRFAFTDCDKLERVSLTAKKIRIEWSAFLNCPRLSEVEIAAKEIDIGAQVFKDCASLKYITFHGVKLYVKDFMSLYAIDNSSDRYRPKAQ